jgi:hypothetical protein
MGFSLKCTETHILSLTTRYTVYSTYAWINVLKDAIWSPNQSTERRTCTLCFLLYECLCQIPMLSQVLFFFQAAAALLHAVQKLPQLLFLLTRGGNLKLLLADDLLQLFLLLFCQLLKLLQAKQRKTVIASCIFPRV